MAFSFNNSNPFNPENQVNSVYRALGVPLPASGLTQPANQQTFTPQPAQAANQNLVEVEALVIVLLELILTLSGVDELG
jgi:hypothetical protein